MKRSKDKFYIETVFLIVFQMARSLQPERLTKEIGLSEKSVRNRLNELSDFLLQNKLGEIQRKPRVGIWLEANEKSKRRNTENIIR